MEKNLLKHIYEISSLLARSSDFENILEQIVDRAMTGLNFDRAAILLLNDNKTSLSCLCIRGCSDEIKKRAEARPIILSEYDCIEKKAIELGEPLYIDDFENHPLATEIDKIANRYFQRKEVLYVPLKVKGEILGIIGADRYRTQMDITQSDIEAMTIFANQASIIIENAKFNKSLYDEKMLSENVIRSSVSGIIVSDIKGNIQIINPRALEILGASEDILVGVLLQDVLKVDVNEKRKIVKSWNKVDIISNLELNYVRADSNKLILDVRICPLLDAKRNVQGLIVLFDDITEKKKMDDYLLRLDKFAALGGIASGIAHEIRNPLAAIYTIIQYLEHEYPKEDFQKTCLQIIKSEIDRIEKLIREILNISKPSPLMLRSTNIHDLLLSVVALVNQRAVQKDIVIKTSFYAERVILNVDPDRIKQVFLNLMINAIESIEEKGEILVGTKLENDQFGIRKCILITIKDTGSGISDFVINKIFDPFYSTKKVGTGLGLTISYKIIRDHGGTISVTSTENVGTTFEVVLPTIDEE